MRHVVHLNIAGLPRDIEFRDCEKRLIKRLAAVGVDVGEARVTHNPVTGQGDGRGELLIRGVVGAEGKAKLLATLKANPDAMLGAAPRGVKYDGSRADDGEDAITYDGSGIDANNAAQQRAQRQNRLHAGLGASRTR